MPGSQTKDRHELRFRCAVRSRDAGTSFAQPVSRTIFEPGGIAPFPHAIAKSGRREGLAVRGYKKRQVAARPGIDRGLQFRQDGQVERHHVSISMP